MLARAHVHSCMFHGNQGLGFEAGRQGLHDGSWSKCLTPDPRPRFPLLLFTPMPACVMHQRQFYNFSFPALDPEYTNNVCAMPDGLPNEEPSVQELLLIPAFDPEYTNNVCAMPDGLPNEEPSVQELLLIL